MSKLLGKKQMLGLLTAGAIVVTTAGSFAMWDTLTATSTGTVTLDKPITVTATAGTYTSGVRTLDERNTYTAPDVTFNVTNTEALSTSTLTLAPVVKIGETDVSGDFVVVIKDSDGTALNQNKDTSVEATNKYTVELTPIETPSQDVMDAAANSTAVTVEITGTLTGTLN